MNPYDRRSSPIGLVSINLLLSVIYLMSPALNHGVTAGSRDEWWQIAGVEVLRSYFNTLSENLHSHGCHRPSWRQPWLKCDGGCAKLGYDLPVLRTAQSPSRVSGLGPDDMHGVLRDEATRRDRVSR